VVALLAVVEVHVAVRVWVVALDEVCDVVLDVELTVTPVEEEAPEVEEAAVAELVGTETVEDMLEEEDGSELLMRVEDVELVVPPGPEVEAK